MISGKIHYSPDYIGTDEQAVTITFDVKSPSVNESDQDYAERIDIDSILQRFKEKIADMNAELLKGYHCPDWTHMVAFEESEHYDVNDGVEAAIYLNATTFETYDPGSATCPPSYDCEAGFWFTPGVSALKDCTDDCSEKRVADALIAFLDENGVSYDKDSIKFNATESKSVDLSSHDDRYYDEYYDD